MAPKKNNNNNINEKPITSLTKEEAQERLAQVRDKLSKQMENDQQRFEKDVKNKNNNNDDDDDDLDLDLPADDEDSSGDEEYREALAKFGGRVNNSNNTNPKNPADDADEEDEDDPYLIGKEGTKIKRPLGTKREVKELAQYSRAVADFSFADAVEADPLDGLKPITWTQLKTSVGYEREARGFKLVGVICTRDQANWDKIKHIEVRDDDGVEKALFFYDSNAETFSWEDCTVGNRIVIKEPRFHRFMDGSEGLRVESCAQILSITQQKFSDEDRLNFGRRHKQNGNLKYEQRRYDDAVDEYDHAIRHLSGTFKETPESEAAAKELCQSCFLNVAACFVAEGKFTQVERPCRRALTFNANNTLNSKAYYRIGQAQEALGNYSNARVALERANQLLPGDPKIISLLQKVNGISKELTSAQRQLYSQKEDKIQHQVENFTNNKDKFGKKSPMVIETTYVNGAPSTLGDNQDDNELPTPSSPGTGPVVPKSAFPGTGREEAATSNKSSSSTKKTKSGVSSTSSANSRRRETPTPKSQHLNSNTPNNNGAGISPTSSINNNNNNNVVVPKIANYRFGFQTSVLNVLSNDGNKIQMESVENFRDVGGLKIFRTVTNNNNNKNSRSSNTNSPQQSPQLGSTPLGSVGGSSTSPSLSSLQQTITICSNIRKHLLYRSGSLVGLTKNDFELVTNRLRIKTIIDLRNNDEINKRIAERKEETAKKNVQRANVRFDMKKAEIAARRRLTQKEKLEKIKRDKYGVVDNDDDGSENKNDGMRNRNEKKINKDTPKFSTDPSVINRDSDDDEEELAAIADFERSLERDPELKDLDFVDYEAHFRPVILTCKPGVVTSLSSKNYDQFIQQNPNMATAVTRQEWIKQMPVALHIDFSSRTIFAMAPWWVWICATLLALCLQINLAALLVVKMTASRVGAVAYYRSMLEHQQEEIREIFTVLADISNFPVLICCELGKDRTGVVMAVILSAIGVPKEEIAADYAKTKGSNKMDEWVAKVGLTAEEWRTAKPETIEGVLNMIEKEEGGIEKYLKSIGISDQVLESVRNNLIA